MTSACTIQPASREHAPQIVETIRGGFSSEQLRLFIYGCHGIARFVEEQITSQQFGGEVRYTAALEGDRVVGCAEMRRLPDVLFLSYIAVNPGHRTQGLGRRLLRDAIRAAIVPGCRRLTLDVIESNSTARAWYEKLGFQYLGSTAWRAIPLTPGPEADVILSEYAQAEVCQREYGFSRFRLHAEGRPYDVGRLGAEWFRLSQREAFDAPGLRSALHRMDAQRRILLMAAGEPADRSPGGEREVLITRRLTMDIQRLLEELERV
jgi:GNAT superfamily N-acetyltransferase